MSVKYKQDYGDMLHDIAVKNIRTNRHKNASHKKSRKIYTAPTQLTWSGHVFEFAHFQAVPYVTVCSVAGEQKETGQRLLTAPH